MLNAKKSWILSLATVIIGIFVCVHTVYGISILNIAEGSQWRYLTGNDKSPDKWNHSGFDDSSWQEGPSGFGYGTGKNKTILKDMKGNYKTVYVRSKFTVREDRKITRMILSIVCDGPFVAYFNNIEIIRSKKRQKGDPLNMIGFAHELQYGTNILSVKCSNDDINSEDFRFVPSFQYSED